MIFSNVLGGAVKLTPSLLRAPVKTAIASLLVLIVTLAHPCQGRAAGIVSFIFDDAAASHATNVAPLFDNRGVKAGFAIASGNIQDDPAKGMTWLQMRKLQTGGHELIGHTHSHADLRPIGISTTILDREFLSSKVIMEREGLNITTFVAPYSRVSCEYMREYVRPVYAQAFTVYDPLVEDSVQKFPLDRHSMHRTNLYMVGLDGAKAAIDKAVAEDGLVVFYDHDPKLISNPKSMPYDDLRRVLDYAIASGAAVLTPRQAIALQERRDSVQ